VEQKAVGDMIEDIMGTLILVISVDAGGGVCVVGGGWTFSSRT